MIPADLVRSVIGQASELSSSAMLDRCEITVPGAPGALDRETAVRAAPTPTTIYSGPCRFKASADTTVEVESRDDSAATTTRAVLVLPTGAPQPPVGATVKLTALANPKLVAAGWLDRSWRTATLPTGPWRADQRVVVQEVNRG